MRRYTAKEIKFLFSKIPGRSYIEVAELFNKRFAPPITTAQVKSFMANNKLQNGRDTRFRPGMIPFNKGKKRWWTGGEETQFKPGQMPWNYRPVGSERINVDGYVEVKVSDPKKWKCKHVVIWEKANGPVPKGCAIIFADGNRMNLKLRNLLLVTRSELAVMNHLGLIFPHKDLTVAGKSIADIKLLIAERNRELKKRRRRKGANNGKRG